MSKFRENSEKIHSHIKLQTRTVSSNADRQKDQRAHLSLFETNKSSSVHYKILSKPFLKDLNAHKIVFQLVKIPSLVEICLNYISTNIKEFDKFPILPKPLIKPLFESTDPEELKRINLLNSHLVKPLNSIWQSIIRKHFHESVLPKEMNNWFEYYLFLSDKRATRIANILKMHEMKEIEVISSSDIGKLPKSDEDKKFKKFNKNAESERMKRVANFKRKLK